MSDDDDDPVVEEIPVYLTHSLAEHLYVFQYPVVPCTSPGHYHVIKSKIKPENEEVALDLGLDVTSPNFDQSHAEQIASGADKDKSGEERLFPKKLMNKIFLESSRILADNDSFGIGLMHGRELHISPIRSVISLTPSFKHLDSPKEDVPEGEESTSSSSALVGIGGKPNNRKNSYSNYTKKIAQEAWHNTEYYDPNTPKAEAERVRLSRCERRSGVWLSSEGWELSSPAAGGCRQGGLAPEQPPQSLGEILAGFPSPLTLVQLASALASKEEHQSLLTRILPFVVVVRGHFLPRSDLLYPPDSFSKVNGVPGEFMVRARDYILYQLNEGCGLNRLSLSDIVRVPREEIDEILQHIAVKTKSQWVFKFAPDEEFINRYSQVMEQQKLVWEARFRQVMESFESAGSPKPPRRRRESSVSSTEGASRQPSRSKHPS